MALAILGHHGRPFFLQRQPRLCTVQVPALGFSHRAQHQHMFWCAQIQTQHALQLLNKFRNSRNLAGLDGMRLEPIRLLHPPYRAGTHAYDLRHHARTQVRGMRRLSSQAHNLLHIDCHFSSTPRKIPENLHQVLLSKCASQCPAWTHPIPSSSVITRFSRLTAANSTTRTRRANYTDRIRVRQLLQTPLFFHSQHNFRCRPHCAPPVPLSNNRAGGSNQTFRGS